MISIPSNEYRIILCNGIQFTPTCNAWTLDQLKDGIDRFQQEKQKDCLEALWLCETRKWKNQRKTIICHLCKWEIPYSGNTTNLFAHLQNYHKAQYLELKKVVENQKTIQSTIAWSQQLPTLSPRYKELVSAVGSFLAMDMQPMSSVEGYGLLKLRQVAKSWFTVPSRKYFRTRTANNGLINLVFGWFSFFCLYLITCLYFSYTSFCSIYRYIAIYVTEFAKIRLMG